MALYKRYKLNDRSIRPEWDKIAGHKFSAFNDEIKQGRINLVPTACICGSKADKIISERDRLGSPCRYVICLNCGLIRANPTMDAESTRYFYEHHYQALYHTEPGRTVDNETEFKGMSDYSAAHYLPKAVLVDNSRVIMIGCGTGAALMPFHKAGHKCIGADYAEEKINFGRAQGLDLRAGHYETLLKNDYKADLVLLSHVMEHFVDLADDFAKISQMLSDNGTVMIDVPDITKTYLYPRGDLLYGAFICHNYWFSPESLDNTMSLLGFERTSAQSQTGTSVIALYSRAKKGTEKTILPNIAAVTLRRIKLIETLYKVRQSLGINSGLEGIRRVVSANPNLKKLALKILRAIGR